MVVVANPWQFSGDVFFLGGFGKNNGGKNCLDQAVE